MSYSVQAISPYEGTINVPVMVMDLNLQPGDVLKVRSKGLALVDHYAVYLGYWESQYWFSAAMMSEGVVVFSEDRIEDLSRSYYLKEVRYLEGATDSERRASVERALYAHGKSYSLVGYNCENYANYVQTGESWSLQTRKVGVGAMAVGATMALASENKNVRTAGAIIGLAGLFAMLWDEFA